MFRPLTADVLETKADALLLTLDGARAGLEGNVARQFARRWPDDWQDMTRRLRFPIPLGRTVAIPWEGDAPWKLFLFASTLHHVDILDDSEKARIASKAFHEALKLCAQHRACSIATVMFTGGWRLSRDQAIASMFSPANISLITSYGIEVRLCDRE